MCMFVSKQKKKKKITLNEHQRKKTNANFFLQENQALTRREELLQQKIIVNITLTQIMSHKVELSFYPIEGTSMRQKLCIKIVFPYFLVFGSIKKDKSKENYLWSI